MTETPGTPERVLPVTAASVAAPGAVERARAALREPPAVRRGVGIRELEEAARQGAGAVVTEATATRALRGAEVTRETGRVETVGVREAMAEVRGTGAGAVRGTGAEAVRGTAGMLAAAAGRRNRSARSA